MMGHFSHFRFPAQIEPTLIKKTRQTTHSTFQPITVFRDAFYSRYQKKKSPALEQDYSLWVKLLIMPSTWGHFVSFLSASKQLDAALLSWKTTPAAIAGNHVAEKTWNWCHLEKPHLLPSRNDSATPRELFFANHIDAFVIDAGPVFLLFRYTPNQLRASLLTFPKNCLTQR